MSLNLHNIVRGAIQSVNPDITAAYLASIGYIQSTEDGRQVPIYATPVAVQIQVQPPSSKDLQHVNFLNLQGIIRTVYIYGWPQGVNRVNVQGGDLLMFPQTPGAPVDNWLVEYVPETWAPDSLGWTKLIVTLQTDGRLIVLDSSNLPVIDSSGALVYSS